eukprot:4191825-Amphidinium_carterae.1
MREVTPCSHTAFSVVRGSGFVDALLDCLHDKDIHHLNQLPQVDLCCPCLVLMSTMLGLLAPHGLVLVFRAVRKAPSSTSGRSAHLSVSAWGLTTPSGLPLCIPSVTPRDHMSF